MLVQFKVQNFTSFNSCQTFSLFSSTATKENYCENNAFQINKFGITHLLKSAVIFGANASGKSNFILALQVLRNIILKSLSSPAGNNLENILPFLLKTNPFDLPTEFEICFIQDGCFYRYGIAIIKGIIDEEWLYCTVGSRESNLFYREKQTIKINKRSFAEAKAFISNKGEYSIVEKTREDVPFVAVLAQFNGQKSRQLIDWFKKLEIVSGLEGYGYSMFTINLFESDHKFKTWALEILSSLQIDDIRVYEEDHGAGLPLFQNTVDANFNVLNNVVSNLNQFLQKNILKTKKLQIVKKVDPTSHDFIIPFELESEGTKKLIYLLGPLYDIITNNKVLVIDEFDNKFHSLLSSYIISLYHKNKSNSQLIITCHDTNLLAKELFRRDQIWFIEKNQKYESEIYSLVEYKEHYTRKDNNYRKDYLTGKYGAIPLFKSLAELDVVLNG